MLFMSVLPASLKISDQLQQRKSGDNVFLNTEGQLYSQLSGLTKIRTHPSFNACSHYLKISKGSDEK